jgi:multidrug efflux pump
VAAGVRRTPRWMAVYGAVLVACVFLFLRLPSSFLPQEDQGYAIAIVQLPSGATIDRTRAVLARMNEIMHTNAILDKSIQVAGFSFVGQGENVGLAFMRLKEWGDRDESVDDFIAWANKAFSGIKEAQIFVVNLPTIRGLGQFSGFDFRLQDRAGLGAQQLSAARQVLLAKASKDPALTGVRFNGLPDAPQLELVVDRVQAQAMGLSVSDVYSALQLMLAPVYANDFTYEGRVLRVQLQADASFRMSPEDLNRYRVRNQAGQMIPLDSVVRAHWTLGPPSLERYNGFGAAPITGSPAAGHSSGDAMAAMERLTREDLPRGFGFEWSGQSLQEILSGQQAPMLFAISLIVVFLCLAALYESWSIPVAVLLVVPVGVLGALLFTTLRGLPNDIYFKVGLLAIIGLAAKNAILIIAFARDAQLAGKPLIAAILEACRLRFRPIVMTSVAFVLGVLPLAISGGAGANSRHAIGTGVVGGMLAATTLGLLLVPVFYVVVRRLLGDRSTE